MRETTTPPDHFEPFGPMLVCVEHVAIALFALAGLVGCAMADPLRWDAYLFAGWLGGVMLILLTTAVCWHSARGHASLIWPSHLAWQRRVRNADRALVSVAELAAMYQPDAEKHMTRPLACERCGYNIAWCRNPECPECGQPIVWQCTTTIQSLQRARQEQYGSIVAICVCSLVLAFIWGMVRENYLGSNHFCGSSIIMQRQQSPLWELLDLVPIVLMLCLGLLVLWIAMLSPFRVQLHVPRTQSCAQDSADGLAVLATEADA